MESSNVTTNTDLSKKPLNEFFKSGERVTIPCTTGNENIENARDRTSNGRILYPIYCDEKIRLVRPCPETKSVKARIHQLKKSATFSQMFNSFNIDLEKLCLTENQIVAFVKKYSEFLGEEDRMTFFLIKETSDYAIIGVGVQIIRAQVLLREQTCYGSVYIFKETHEWDKKDPHQIVIPII